MTKKIILRDISDALTLASQNHQLWMADAVTEELC